MPGATSEVDLTGKRPAGVPTHIVNVSAQRRFASWLNGRADLYVYGDYPITGDNRVANGGYALLNLSATIALPTRLPLELDLAVTNVLDREIYSYFGRTRSRPLRPHPPRGRSGNRKGELLMRWLITLLIALLAGCGKQATETPAVGRPIPIPHTRTFSVVERDGYRIVDLHANIVTWGGAANGPEQRVRVVLVPRSIKAPALTGDLAGAVMVRTPVKRIAVNYGGSEALLTAIGAADRLVAVGGTKSYDDTIRERVKKGEIGQIGYGWHSPPNLDVLLAAKPDVFLMTIGDPAHADAMRRAIAMGIPVMPSSWRTNRTIWVPCNMRDCSAC